MNWKWLAGFYEGEGSCGWYRHYKKYYGLRSSIAQKHKQSLLKIKRFIWVI